MVVSRRSFIKAGTLSGVSAIISFESVVTALGQESSARQEDLFRIPDGIRSDEQLSEETFLRYIDTQFLVYTSPFTAVKLRLVGVNRWEPSSATALDGRKTNSPERDSFSVMFRGPIKSLLESRTYRITHDQMGTFDLFISPVNDRKKDRIYQAVFNRIK